MLMSLAQLKVYGPEVMRELNFSVSKLFCSGDVLSTTSSPVLLKPGILTKV